MLIAHALLCIWCHALSALPIGALSQWVAPLTHILSPHTAHFLSAPSVVLWLFNEVFAAKLISHLFISDQSIDSGYFHLKCARATISESAPSSQRGSTEKPGHKRMVKIAGRPRWRSTMEPQNFRLLLPNKSQFVFLEYFQHTPALIFFSSPCSNFVFLLSFHVSKHLSVTFWFF